MALGFPAGRALGAMVQSGKAAGGRGFVALPPRQVCFLLAFSAEPGGQVLLRGGEGRLGTWAAQPLPGVRSFPSIHKRLSSWRLCLALCCFSRAEKACCVPALMRTRAVVLQTTQRDGSAGQRLGVFLIW